MQNLSLYTSTLKPLSHNTRITRASLHPLRLATYFSLSRANLGPIHLGTQAVCRTLLKLLAASGVLRCVDAAADPWTADLMAMEKRHAAELKALRYEFYQLEARFEAKLEARVATVREFVGMTPPSSPPASHTRYAQ